MIKAEQVPQAAWLAMRDLMHNGTRNEATPIAAAIKSWPGMDTSTKMTRHFPSGEWRVPVPVIRLPLPTETDNG